MKMSATGDSERSHTVRAACRSPWYSTLLTSAISSRVPEDSFQKEMSCSIARASTKNVPRPVSASASGGTPNTSGAASGVIHGSPSDLGPEVNFLTAGFLP